MSKPRIKTYDTIHPKIDKWERKNTIVKNNSIWELDNDNDEMFAGQYMVQAGSEEETEVGLSRLDGKSTLRKDNPSLIGAMGIFDRDNIPNIFDRHISDPPKPKKGWLRRFFGEGGEGGGRGLIQIA